MVLLSDICNLSLALISAKLKEAIFLGPQIREVLNDKLSK